MLWREKRERERAENSERCVVVEVLVRVEMSVVRNWAIGGGSKIKTFERKVGEVVEYTLRHYYSNFVLVVKWECERREK